jgi:hypothetical protein
MQNPNAARIGLDARGVAVDAGYHTVFQPQNGSRLPGSDSQQLKVPTNRVIRGNFSLFILDYFTYDIV